MEDVVHVSGCVHTMYVLTKLRSSLQPLAPLLQRPTGHVSEHVMYQWRLLVIPTRGVNGALACAEGASVVPKARVAREGAGVVREARSMEWPKSGEARVISRYWSEMQRKLQLLRVRGEW